MYLHISTIVILIFSLLTVNAINILGVFDYPIKSIHLLGYKLLSGLARRGYNVTLLSPFHLEKEIVNFTHIYLDGLHEYKEKNMRKFFQGKSSMIDNINVPQDLLNLGLSSKNVQNLLKSNSSYDIIIQLYGTNVAYLGIAHHFNARVIGYVPYSGFPHITQLTGNSAPYSYVSTPFLGFTNDMTFFQRFLNTIAGNGLNILNKFYWYPRQAEILKNYFPNAPPLEQLERDIVDLVFVNVHFSSDFPKPNTPNLIHIGGYHLQTVEPLSATLKKYLDNAREGAILFAFGSNVDTTKLPKENLDAFLNKFAKIQHKVLFKYDGKLSNKPINVVTSNWYPQTAILAHPNLKAFISHGGKSSVIESLYYGIPTLCISFYADQRKNCEEIVAFGYGIHLPHLDVTEQTFETAFDELIENPKYKKNAEFRAALAREQEMDPLDRASFWIHHVYKFNGAKHLRPKSITLPLYQYLLLDVCAFLLVIFVIIAFVVYRITKLVLKLLFKKIVIIRKIKEN